MIQQIQGLPTGSVEREMAYQMLEDVQNQRTRRIASRAAKDAQQLSWPAELKNKMSARRPRRQIAKWAAAKLCAAECWVDSLAASMAAMDCCCGERVQVVNQAVEDITGPLTRSQWKRIDKTIRTGFLTGATNEQLARAVARTYKANLAERRAITRTAVMSLAQESHNQFWDANDDVIVAWRWDAV